MSVSWLSLCFLRPAPRCHYAPAREYLSLASDLPWPLSSVVSMAHPAVFLVGPLPGRRRRDTLKAEL